MYSIGIDVGGTKVAAGLVSDSGSVVERVTAQTPTYSADAVEDVIVRVSAELMERAPSQPSAIGVGVAGWIDSDQAVVRFSPHLAWRDEPLRERLTNRLPLPLHIDNDANAAAWAEYRFGAGRDSRALLCLTLGTGIGGAMVFRGQVFRGAYGLVGEFGHMTIEPGGHLCECGLERDVAQLLARSSPSSAALARKFENPEHPTGREITAAATAGDRQAIQLIGHIGAWLGRGMASLASALDPDTIVIGGGVSSAGELLRAPAAMAYRESLPGRGYRPEADIRLAKFRNDAGMIGAADLARHALAQPPRPGRLFWPKRRRSRRGSTTFSAWQSSMRGTD